MPLGEACVIGCDARKNSDVFALDTARVAAASGCGRCCCPGSIPTPLLAFSITSSTPRPGVMVTASHNPPADNGYKVYLGDGAQIVPPHDIEHLGLDRPGAGRRARSRRGPRADRAPRRRAAPGLPRVDRFGRRSARHRRRRRRLLAAPRGRRPAAARRLRPGRLPTPTVVERAVRTRPGLHHPHLPEPRGTRHHGSADRAGRTDRGRRGHRQRPRRRPARCRHPAAGWRVAQVDGRRTRLPARRPPPSRHRSRRADRLVVTTLVSSTLLSKMAAAAGVQYAETSTGFKWIARAILDRPELALRDRATSRRWGISWPPSRSTRTGSAPPCCSPRWRRRPRPRAKRLVDLLDELVSPLRASRHRRALGADAARRRKAAVARCATTPRRARLAGHGPSPRCSGSTTPGCSGLQCGPDARVQVRPSGTEPKVKVYGEAVDASPADLVDALASLLA